MGLLDEAAISRGGHVCVKIRSVSSSRHWVNLLLTGAAESGALCQWGSWVGLSVIEEYPGFERPNFFINNINIFEN